MAVVLASFSGAVMIAISAIGGGLLYALVVLLLARRWLHRLETAAQARQGLDGSSLSFILILLMLAAWYTDFVGIYAVFGAFILLGVAMPCGIVSRDLQQLLEPITTHFLVPLFFTYSGLNTRLNLLVSPALWGIVAAVIITAVLGKGLACWAAARYSGENKREALTVGSLMNARGMMELILLNIGLEQGLITETFFTVMVIMAIVTTLMTSPLFERVYGRQPALRQT